MAKRKANIRGKFRKPPRRRSWLGELFRFIILPPVGLLILLVLIAALLFWQRSALISWASNIADKTLMLFGWGLVLIAIAVVVIAGVIWQRQLSALVRRWKLYQWNKWLGGIALTLAVWGIIAFFNLGGSFGLDIIGYPDFNGILRILGLVLIGIILVAPGACFHLVAKSISWLGKQLARQPVPRPTLQQKPAFPSATVTPEPPEIEPERKAVTPVLAPTSAQQELRQVAQEVWKKYGESTALVTIDGWRLPPIDILDRSPEAEFSQADNMERARLIESALPA